MKKKKYKKCLTCSKKFELKINKKYCDKCGVKIGKIQKKEWYYNNKEKAAKYYKSRYRIKNPLKTKECAMCYIMFEPEHNKQIFCSQNCKDEYGHRQSNYYYKRNYKKIIVFCKECGKEFIRKKNDNYCSKNCFNIHIYKYRKNNYIKNKLNIMNSTKAYTRKRLKYDIKFKLRALLAGRIYDALKNNRKSAQTMKLVGCSIEQFKFYLESLFEPGMHWRNWAYNGWHVDHIIPCAKFDLSKPEQQKECFHYTNLRPLWATTEIALKNGCNEIGNQNRPKK